MPSWKFAGAAKREKTKELYDGGNGCRVIAKSLGERPVTTYRRLKRMGLMRNKAEAYALLHDAPQKDLPFRALVGATNLRSAAIGEALRWFLDRGYIASIPVEPTQYDLVVESDKGLKRVQVKSSSRQKYGAWIVQTNHAVYDATLAKANSNGKRRRVQYTEKQIDFFFIVAADNSKFIVPVGVIGDALVISLGKKYAKYKV